MIPAWLYGAAFVVAAVYASVGLGGGSAYLALLALTGVAHEPMRVVVLVMNVVVSTTSFVAFWRAGHLNPRLLAPFLFTSIPAAFVGGMFVVDEELFQLLVAGCLLLVAVRMLTFRPETAGARALPWQSRVWWGPIVGAVTGFLAGLVGIGGGVFLGPILILFGWARPKQASAVAAAFVWLNSVAGLAAHLVRGNLPPSWCWLLVATVLVGGLIGSRLGAVSLSPATVQRAFGVLLLGVVGRLFWVAL